MPLTSSREAAQKRSERARADVKEQRRRENLSLPMTIKSSTKATEAKAMRRRSVRRESLRAKQLDENAQPGRPPMLPYSPPLTRSAKKARRDGDTQSLVLTFSPPDHAENERRHRNEIKMRELQR